MMSTLSSRSCWIPPTSSASIRCRVWIGMRPELGVVLFRRDGWGGERWAKWAKDLLASGTAFVAPTTHKGETVGRLVFMHPTTPMSVLDEVMVSLTA